MYVQLMSNWLLLKECTYVRMHSRSNLAWHCSNPPLSPRLTVAKSAHCHCHLRDCLLCQQDVTMVMYVCTARACGVNLVLTMLELVPLCSVKLAVWTQQLRGKGKQGEKDQWLSSNLGLTLYFGVSAVEFMYSKLCKSHQLTNTH